MRKPKVVKDKVQVIPRSPDDPMEENEVLLLIECRRMGKQVGNVSIRTHVDFTHSPRREVEATFGLASDFIAMNLLALASTPAMGDDTPDGAAIVPVNSPPPARVVDSEDSAHLGYG